MEHICMVWMVTVKFDSSKHWTAWQAPSRDVDFAILFLLQSRFVLVDKHESQSNIPWKGKTLGRTVVPGYADPDVTHQLRVVIRHSTQQQSIDDPDQRKMNGAAKC